MHQELSRLHNEAGRTDPEHQRDEANRRSQYGPDGETARQATVLQPRNRACEHHRQEEAQENQEQDLPDLAQEQDERDRYQDLDDGDDGEIDLRLRDEHGRMCSSGRSCLAARTCRVGWGSLFAHAAPVPCRSVPQCSGHG